jgi:hypothetical protein
MNSRSVIPNRQGRSPEKLTVSVDGRLLRVLRQTAKASGTSASRLTEKALEALLASPSRNAVVGHGPREARSVAVKLARAGAAPEAIADALNCKGFRTATGMEWSRFSAYWLLHPRTKRGASRS